MSSSQGTGTGIDSILDQALNSIGDTNPNGTGMDGKQTSPSDDLDFLSDVMPVPPLSDTAGNSPGVAEDILDELMPATDTLLTKAPSRPVSAFDEMFGSAPVVPAQSVAAQDSMGSEVAEHSSAKMSAQSAANQDAMDDLLNFPSVTGGDLDDLLDLSAMAGPHDGAHKGVNADNHLSISTAAGNGGVVSDLDDFFAPAATTQTGTTSDVFMPQQGDGDQGRVASDLDDLYAPVASVKSAPSDDFMPGTAEGEDSLPYGGSDDFFEPAAPAAAAIKEASSDTLMQQPGDDTNGFIADGLDDLFDPVAPETVATRGTPSGVLMEPSDGDANGLVTDGLDNFFDPVAPEAAATKDTPHDATVVSTGANDGGDLLDDLLTTTPAADPGLSSGGQADLDDDPLNQWSSSLPDDEQLDDILTSDEDDEDSARAGRHEDYNDFMSLDGGEQSHEDVLSAIPTHPASEDLSLLLDTIAPPANASQAKRHAVHEEDGLMSLSSVLSATASDAVVEPAVKNDGRAFAETGAQEAGGAKTSGKKMMLRRVARFTLGLSLLGGAGFAAWTVFKTPDVLSVLRNAYSSQFETTEPDAPGRALVENKRGTDTSAPLPATNAVPGEVDKLRAEVADLSEKLTLVLSSKGSGSSAPDGPTLELIAKYDEIMRAQQNLIQEQARYAALSEQMRLQLETYETNMLSRFEKVVGLTSKVATQNAEQAQLIKDAVLREAIAAINAKTSGADSGKIAVLQKEIVDAKSRIEQLSQTVVAQRQVQTVLESEIQEMKEGPAFVRRGAKPTTPTKSNNQTSGAKVVVDAEPESPFPDAGNDELVLVGVQSKKGGVFDIYVEPSDPNDMTGVVPYLFGPNQSSVIPGYGRILSVNKIEGAQSMVPYVVVTEMGEIRGKR